MSTRTFAAEYKPAHTIGGDFYGFIPIAPGRMGVLIGDVSAKGVSAALLMARVTSEFRGFGPVEEVLRTGSGDAEATLEDLMLVIRGFVKQAPQYDDLTTVCFGRELPEVHELSSELEPDPPP